MIHMLDRFDLRPGVEEDRFRLDFADFAAGLRNEDLIVDSGPVGRREADTPMDTDAAVALRYFVLLSFRDRDQVDAAWAHFSTSMAGPRPIVCGAVLAAIGESAFTCWRDLD